MDFSAVIFVALAVAWAAYLIPMALKHHNESARSRTVDAFSHGVRVLARREAVDRRSAQLVTPGQPTEAPLSKRAQKKVARAAAKQAAAEAAPTEHSPAQVYARRAAAKRATKRRRNVLGLLLLANLAVVGVAAFAVISWWYVAIPAGLLVAWLVACRLMVKGERRALMPGARPTARPSDPPAARPTERPNARQSDRLPADVPGEDEAPDAPQTTEAPVAPAAVTDEVDPMADTSAGIAAIVDPAMWDPVPVTLPTYVSKPAAERRSVRTIDLDATGVWTSGRTEADSKLAREADQADKEARESRRDGDDQRAVGS